MFKGYIWVTGGRVDLYVMYNLLDSYKVADVWKSKDGGQFSYLVLAFAHLYLSAIWTQEKQMTGDYYAQNIDVVQPGLIAPW